jgi:LexA-binding, inner membrane-associated putative hydrolase
MLLWFAGLSVLMVWQVFHDPRIDYRLVVAGALLPDVVDGALGGARVLHSLSFSAVLLLAVMAATRGRRVVRRRLLAVPIGTFLHLVLDGMWARTEVFWWPFTGWSFGDAPLPSFDRSPVLVVAMEVAGVVALWWFAALRAEEPTA